jgi:predicted nucleic-acid-binding Zn-ribbon protein
MIKLDDKSVLNCPKCGKEYNMEEYEKLDKAETLTYDEPIISVRGKSAPKEALIEIAKRTGGKLYDERVDIFNREKDEIYDARTCYKCGTEFGFVKIVNKTNEETIFHIDLDLSVAHKDESNLYPLPDVEIKNTLKKGSTNDT